MVTTPIGSGNAGFSPAHHADFSTADKLHAELDAAAQTSGVQKLAPASNAGAYQDVVTSGERVDHHLVDTLAWLGEFGRPNVSPGEKADLKYKLQQNVDGLAAHVGPFIDGVRKLIAEG